jgi:trimeric autotransporter adhesin
MFDTVRYLKRSGQSEGRSRKLRQHLSGHHRRLICETLETRTLLSVALAQSATAAQHQTLSDLPVAAQQAISSAIGQDQSTYHAAPAAGGVSLANPANGFTAQVQAGALHVSAGSDTWDMALTGLGYGGAVQSVGTAQTSANGNRVDSNFGKIDEWYVNGPSGLEQGFTVAPLPQSQATSSLTVVLALGGNLSGTVNSAGDGLTLTRPNGLAVLGYTGLVAYDATGKTLPASLEVQIKPSHQDLLIHVNAFGAQGAITIDPFVQAAKLTASDGAAQDWFGCSVSVSGNTVVVGAPMAVANPSRPGTAYVFTESASGWANMTETAKLTANDGAANDLFGGSISISGNTVVVGASGATVGGNSGQGAAYVFTLSGSGWGQTAKLTASKGAARSYFGVSVSISGNTVVIGATGTIAGRNLEGAAYVFTGSGSTWIQAANLTASDGTTYTYFGRSVSINESGSTVVVGADGNNAAYVFTKPARGWGGNKTQTAKLTASDGGGPIGSSVSISGNTVVVGARLSPIGSNTQQGAAYVFTEPSGGWPANMTQTAKLIAYDGAAYDQFGFSVSISGNTMVVGNAKQGAAYVFTWSGNAWIPQIPKLTASDGAAGDVFGFSVSISGNTVVVGAPRATVGSNTQQGAAYVFAAPSVTSIAPTSGPTTGGTTVTITGAGFTGETAVKFGAVLATSVIVVSDTQITATSPAESAGTVDVTVTNPVGTSATTLADQFTYTTAPLTVQFMTPTAAPLAGSTSVATAQPLSASTAPVATATQDSPASGTGADMLPLPTVGPQPVRVSSAQILAAHHGVAVGGLAAWSVDRVLADLSALDRKTVMLSKEVAC